MEKPFALTTRRLVLREMDERDRPALAAILQDAITMTAYEHAFSDGEVDRWLENQRRRYREDGFGLWAATLQSTGEMIGQCGLSWQPVPLEDFGPQVPEIGYLFNRAFWHQGYATEAAVACKQYAFEILGFDAAYSVIRDSNTASQRVAVRNGMRPVATFIKHYHGVDMPHILYRARRDDAPDGLVADGAGVVQ